MAALKKDIDSESVAISVLDAVAHPVWIFARDTYHILYANPKALDWLGYDRSELETLTIIELRPEEERERLKQQVQNFTQESCDAGLWTITAKSGHQHRATFYWHRMQLRGSDLVLATIIDQNQTLQAQHASLTKAIQVAEQEALWAEDAYRKIFEAVPGKMLVLEPKTYRIIAVTDAFLPIMMKERSEIYGKLLFDIFPDNPDDPDADGVSHLRASLRKVETLGLQDAMPVQRYPIRNRDGVFVDRFWMPFNKPVFDSAGKLIYIIHRTEDVTALQTVGPQNRPDESDQRSGSQIDVSQAQELQSAVMLLHEYETRLRTVRRLFKLGSWEFDVERNIYHFSDRVLEIFGISPADRAPFNDSVFMSLVHPDDRERIKSEFTQFRQNREPIIAFEHRIKRHDGSIAYVKGMAERHHVGARELVLGYIQDISEFALTETKLAAAQELIQIAGEKLQIGGWRIDRDMQSLVLSDSMYRMFEADPGIEPDFGEGSDLLQSPDRDRIMNLLRRCIMDGLSFDEAFTINTVKARPIRVRLLGWPHLDQAGRIIGIQGAAQDLTLLYEAEERVAEADSQRRTILESISDAFFTLDHDFRFTYLNSRAEDLLLRGHDSLIGKDIWQEFPQAIGSAFESSYRRAMRTGKTQHFQDHFALLEKWFDVSAYPVADGLAVYFRDATKDVEKAQHLKLLEAAASRLNDALVITESTPTDSTKWPKIVYVNPAAERMTGFSQAELVGTSPSIMQGPDTPGPELEKLHRAMRAHLPVNVELKNYNKAGRPYWVDISMSPVFDDAGNCTNFVAVERDVSDWKKAQAKLEFAAAHDAVTGLCNRARFEENLKRDLQRMKSRGQRLALILIDCDNFKAVNDTLGHSVGDALLRAIAERLSAILRPDAVFGRLGGDEFVISVPDIEIADAMQFAEWLRRAMLDPFIADGERLSVTASIGVAISPHDAQDADQLIRNADMAMYRSKATGKNQVTRFDKSLRDATIRQAGLTQALHVALTEQTGFRLAYQPLFCARRNRVIGAEALLRWDHTERGSVSPAEFIPAAENAGLIRMLDRMVIDNTIEQLAQWRRNGLAFPISINLSAISLQDAGIGDDIVTKLAASNVAATLFGVEITESLFLESSQSVLTNLHVLRQAGVRISIDDFGTGHSALSYLQKLPLDAIKIDRSFVERIEHAEGVGNPLITAIIAIANALQLRVVAEGVETQDQADWLIQNDCDVLQGFLLGKPVDAIRFIEKYGDLLGR